MITVSVPKAALSAVGGTETTIMTWRTEITKGDSYVIMTAERCPWPYEVAE